MKVELTLSEKKTGWEPQSGKEYLYTTKVMFWVSGIFLPTFITLYCGYDKESARRILKEQEEKLTSPEVLKKIEDFIREEKKKREEADKEYEKIFKASLPRIIERKQITI